MWVCTLDLPVQMWAWQGQAWPSTAHCSPGGSAGLSNPCYNDRLPEPLPATTVHALRLGSRGTVRTLSVSGRGNVHVPQFYKPATQISWWLQGLTHPEYSGIG